MKIISHRGNINGPNSEVENNLYQIQQVLKLGYDVEIDLRVIDNKLYLGHDSPTYETTIEFLSTPGLWIHCKNIEALRFLLNYPGLNFFFHDTDDCVLTSLGYIWTYPRNILLTDKSIAVMPEAVKDWKLDNCAGVCTDYPEIF